VVARAASATDGRSPLSIRAGPARSRHHWYRATTRTQSRQFSGGWEDYEWRRHATFRTRPRDFPQPLWLGKESLAGRTILLHSEQGLGDTLQFVRYAPLVAQRGARVLLLVQPPLQRLLASLDGVSVVDTVDPIGNSIDFHCPLMSLPHAFGTDLDTAPTFRRPKAKVCATGLGGPRPASSKAKRRVVEKGSQSNKIDQRRSMTRAARATLGNLNERAFREPAEGPPRAGARRRA
jgi:hypothetical protein